MKKRKKMLIAVFMAFMLVFTGMSGIFSMSAYAQDEVSEDTVAMVGDTPYDSLEDAVQSITGKGTVKIVSDVSLSDDITIPKGVSVTLTSDENSHTISSNQRDSFIFEIEEGGTLILDSDYLTMTKDKNTKDVSGLVLCQGTFKLEKGTLDGNGNTIGTRSGIVQICGSKAEFTMNGGAIKNAVVSQQSGGVRVCCDGKFYMNDGTITDMKMNDIDSGAVFVFAANDYFTTGSAYFEMNGGVIENNAASYCGGGVTVLGADYTYRAAMVLNGGTIQKNTSGRKNPDETSNAGGGIYIEGNAEVTMNDGNILNNTVNGGVGGGVAASDGFWNMFSSVEEAEQMGFPIDTWSRFYPARFTMNGGTIRGNTSVMDENQKFGGCGGGIYAASNTVELKGGVIEDNHAESQGGGVYVGSIPYQLKISDALITGNTASVLGGGVWACPTGDTEVFVTNGAGIYENRAAGAGDDVVSVRTPDKNYKLTLANRMLGGGQVLWYKDGGIKDGENSLGNPDDSSRYDADGENTPITKIQNSSEAYALKAVVSENAKTLAENSAKLIIKGNTSARGGGIGTNGGIIMGEKDTEYTLKVKKEWKDTEERLKKPVTVSLKVGDTVLDSVTLQSDNNWEAEFTQLPDPDTLAGNVSYSVVENPVPDNFKAEYEKADVDKDNHTITIGVTNTYQEPSPGNLTVAKEVTGTQGDKTKDFHFTVTLDDKSINGNYGDMEFKNGTAEITLKHGEKKTAAELEAGIGYTVEETEANEDGYVTSASGEKGTIPENDTAEVKFTNQKDGEPEQPPESNEPPAPPSEPSTSSTSEEEKTPAPKAASKKSKTSESPKTEDRNYIGFYAALFAVSSLLLVIRKKR